MLHNDTLRSLRFILKANNARLAEICGLGGVEISAEEIGPLLTKEDEPDFVRCPDKVLAGFLDGLIYSLRGKDEARPLPPFELPISNNLVMKKLRVAFQLRDEDMIETIESTGFLFGKAELSAIMRKKGHHNYRECGDQVLRNFLRGLATRQNG